MSFDCLWMFWKMIHEKKAPGSDRRWCTRSFSSNYARVLAIVLEFVCVVFFVRLGCASKGQTQRCFSGAACQHDSLSSRAEKCIQSMSPVTGTLTACRKQEGSYTCKIRAEICVEQGESLQEAVVTVHMLSTGKCWRAHFLLKVWYRNQRWTL